MKKKFTFGLVAVCGLVLAGCYGGSSATSSSSAKAVQQMEEAYLT